MKKPSRILQVGTGRRGLTVAILGRGRAGRALARSLREAGISCRFLSRRVAAASPIGTSVVALAVPDDAIAASARRLAPRAAGCRLAIHLSGARGASALEPFRRRGIEIASFHPLDSFSGRATETFAGSPIAIEGSAGGVRRAFALARSIRAHPWRIRASCKPSYHAAATLAAGGTATIVAAAARLGAEAGLPQRAAFSAYARLAGRAADNIARRGWPAGLTGPLARGDRRTVEVHVRALSGAPELAQAYKALRQLTFALGRVDRRARRH